MIYLRFEVSQVKRHFFFSSRRRHTILDCDWSSDVCSSDLRRRLAGDYDEVNAPQMLDKSLWETSGHWEWYRENMFAAQSAGDEAEDKRFFVLKPMNCPGHVQIFKHGLKSYRELPIRLAEFGMVHRYEPSGAMHGLLRVRGFTQDDAHIFCTEGQLAAESLKINELSLSVYE